MVRDDWDFWEKVPSRLISAERPRSTLSAGSGAPSESFRERCKIPQSAFRISPSILRTTSVVFSALVTMEREF